MRNYNENFLAWAPLIYGRYWRTNICKHLEYTHKTVRNWAHHVTEPPFAIIQLLQVYMDLGWKYCKEENTVKKVRKNAKS